MQVEGERWSQVNLPNAPSNLVETCSTHIGSIIAADEEEVDPAEEEAQDLNGRARAR